MIVRRATYDDLKYIACNMRAADATEIFCCRWDDDPKSLAHEIFCMGTFYPVFLAFADDDGDPIAFLGVSALTPTLGLAHMFATDDFNLIWRDMVKHVLRYVVPALIEFGFHRVEARAQESYDQSRRLLEALGFEYECDLSDYGKGGECFTLYAYLANEFMKGKSHVL